MWQNCEAQERYLQCFACCGHAMTLTERTTANIWNRCERICEFVVTADAHRHHDHQHTNMRSVCVCFSFEYLFTIMEDRRRQIKKTGTLLYWFQKRNHTTQKKGSHTHSRHANGLVKKCINKCSASTEHTHSHTTRIIALIFEIIMNDMKLLLLLPLPSL